MTPSPADRAKIAAAARALDLVEPGMAVGLGTGSTAAWFVRLLGAKVRSGLKVRGIATSRTTAELAAAQKIPLAELDDLRPDLTVDGADELDGRLDLIKGGGGALLKEKIVAAAGPRMVVIADAGKRVGTLGAFPLPLEIVRFGAGATKAAVEAVLAGAAVEGRRAVLRTDCGRRYLTDEGHLILDLFLNRINDPARLDEALGRVPGVVETGLFLGMAEAAFLGRPDGRCTIIRRKDGSPEETAVDLEGAMRSLDV
jgi:ribose 5-phosphate isomerase A